MKEKLNIIINLVGDPNQNIYQFRSSSDKYLMEFEAKTFYLTCNFRSYKSIINFSKYLRPYAKDSDIVCTKGKNNCKPQIAFHKDDTELEDSNLQIVISLSDLFVVFLFAGIIDKEIFLYLIAVTPQ